MFLMYMMKVNKLPQDSGYNRSQKKEDGSGKLRLSIFFNILLVIMVAAMFMIAVNSDNPNILNYETTIINKYASWDQELTERENKIREKEAELFTD